MTSGIEGSNARALENDAFQRAVCALRRGEAVAFPTDTVFGLGVSVETAASPQILCALKRRDEGKPIAWLVAGQEALMSYGKDVPAYAHALASAFWPGALTVIVNAADTVAQSFQSSEGTIGLRMPDSAIALALINAAGAPLATTSANFAGSPAPASSAELDPAFAAAVPFVLSETEQARLGLFEKGDACEGRRFDRPAKGIASTVVDCTGASPKIVREGAITQEQINCALSRFASQ